MTGAEHATSASAIGTGEPGPLDAITDVPGVRVGHRTIVRGDDGAPDAVRTGVTAIFPHEGQPWHEWVYAGHAHPERVRRADRHQPDHASGAS